MRLIIGVLNLLLLTAIDASCYGHVPADGDIHATLGPFAFTNDDRKHEIKSPLIGAAALIVEADLDHNGGPEMAIFYLNQLFSMEREGRVIAERVQRIYITLGYRHWLTPSLSGAAAFFSSYYMGDPELVRSDYGTEPAPKTSASDPTEYGFDFSIQYEPWRRERWSAVIDGRYSLSVTAKEGEESNHFGVLVGVKYFVQGHETPPP
ncbi:MAG: hypothetical protein AB7G93_04330 [Bdellovibrionales bacterium]